MNLLVFEDDIYVIFKLSGTYLSSDCTGACDGAEIKWGDGQYVWPDSRNPHGLMMQIPPAHLIFRHRNTTELSPDLEARKTAESALTASHFAHSMFSSL